MDLVLNTPKMKLYLNWSEDFVSRIKVSIGSQSTKFSIENAIAKGSDFFTEKDKVFIEIYKFLESKPLNHNQFFTYLTSYECGKELPIDVFNYDKEVLKKEYAKIDESKQKKGEYIPKFSLKSYERYVMFMFLKLYGLWSDDYNEEFNIKQEDGRRQYNPLTAIPKILRAELPFKVKEYDISRAFSSFIDAELGIKDRKTDVYSLIEKKKFNLLLNMHKNSPKADISNVRKQLEVVYGEDVCKVITEERFNNKGKLFRELELTEQKYINRFVTENKIENFARLHDGVYVLADSKDAEIMTFDNVTFKVKQDIKPIKIENNKSFWWIDDKGKIQTDAYGYKDFFIQQKFKRVSIEGNDELMVFKDTNNVVMPYNVQNDTSSFLMRFVPNHLQRQVANKVATDSHSIIKSGYRLIPAKPLEYYVDSFNTFGLGFKNGFFEYNYEADKIVKKDFNDVDGFFAPNQTQKVSFEYTEEEGYLENFVYKIFTGKNKDIEPLEEEDKKIMKSVMQMIGYLASNYKNRAFCPAIILSDEGSNDVDRKGGRGKSILANFFTYMQPSIFKGSDTEFKPEYIHNFADLTKEVSSYIIDDVSAGFNYNAMYPSITGDISSQKKGKHAENIPFKDTPKFIITTNFSVRYNEDDESTKRRFYEFKVKPYYTTEHTPSKEFGMMLFSNDYTNEDWSKEYSFIFRCVKEFKSNGSTIDRIKYDKDADNFIAYFHSEARLLEFERILEVLYQKGDEFNATDVFKVYNAYDNPLRTEKLFNIRNIGRDIKYYSKSGKNYNLTERRCRKWSVEKVNYDDNYMIDYDEDFGVPF